MMNAPARLALTRSAMLLMEAMWAYALVAFLCALIVEGDRPSPFGVVAVVFISFSISRLLMQSDLSIGVIRVWGIVMSLLVFYVIVRIDFFGDLRLWDFSWVDKLLRDTSASLQSQAAKTAATGIPLLWFVWMRGVFRGAQHISFESVAGNFAIGVVVVAIVEAFVGVVDAPATVGHVAVPYIAVGLLAIATTQAARADGDSDRPFATTFLGVVGGAILVLTVLGLLFALADLSGVAHVLGVVSAVLGAVISRIVYYILYPFIMLTIAHVRSAQGDLDRCLRRPAPNRDRPRHVDAGAGRAAGSRRRPRVVQLGPAHRHRRALGRGHPRWSVVPVQQVRASLRAEREQGVDLR